MYFLACVSVFYCQKLLTLQLSLLFYGALVLQWSQSMGLKNYTDFKNEIFKNLVYLLKQLSTTKIVFIRGDIIIIISIKDRDKSCGEI